MLGKRKYCRLIFTFFPPVPLSTWFGLYKKKHKRKNERKEIKNKTLYFNLPYLFTILYFPIRENKTKEWEEIKKV